MEKACASCIIFQKFPHSIGKEIMVVYNMEKALQSAQRKGRYFED